MAFSSTLKGQGVIGNKKFSYGVYTNGGSDTGGNIDTGLPTCEQLQLQPTGAAVIASAPVVNETLPIAGSAITIVTTADEDGTWFAFGY